MNATGKILKRGTDGVTLRRPGSQPAAQTKVGDGKDSGLLRPTGGVAESGTAH
jgi:hypothetical protein